MTERKPAGSAYAALYRARKEAAARESESRRPESSRPDEPPPAVSLNPPPESSRPESRRPELREGLVFAREYATIPNAVFDDICPTLPESAQAIYVQFARLAFGHKRNWCRISAPGIAKRTGLGLSTVKRQLALLKLRGLVEVVEYAQGKGDQTPLYHVPVPGNALAESRRPERSRPESRRPESAPMKDSETNHGKLWQAHRHEYLLRHPDAPEEADAYADRMTRGEGD